jgi:large subunit ribosomal protein L5
MKAEKARLETLYSTQLKAALQKELEIKNVMQVLRLEKIVVNIGVKDAIGDSKALGNVQKILSKIAGQSSLKTIARRSIAGFKLREGMAIGSKVTLRRRRMYEFLDRLINIALPRVRDFQGVSIKLDGNGNYNLGIKDWMIFPEIDYDTVDTSRGMNITFETNTSNDVHARALLKSFNMPFKRQ